MRMRKLKRSIGLFLYDRQISGKYFNTARKSFREVFQTLQGERKQGERKQIRRQ